MAAQYVSVNGGLVLADDAKIGVSDLAMHRGYGIFDYFKLVDGKPVFIDEHFDRFFNSAREMHLDTGLNRTQLRSTVEELITMNNMPASGVKLLLTGGYSEDGYKMGVPNLLVMQYPLNFPKENALESGLKLASYNHVRQLPHIKTIDYLAAVRLHPFLGENGLDDILYHKNGIISECPRANFFIVTAREIITPTSNILKGITRSKVLGLNIDGYRVVERDFGLDEMFSAKEAFITSTTQYALPVTMVDGKTIGDGKIGTVTRQVRHQLYKLI
ncbi:aminotransferase class IV [Mucilaginibacter sp. L3T2-6]|uniref:aminotransferase class IV n=1 Tax=Mucilaginibacter sp. L3T2-6 TaxID=3062491 RepID=UPI0026751247|nr:aminotransferase class IV [Mucilaginibacter sp. L3T2-6]MDO3644761.1 aminotransferase class IV [Mucilaginibacter sp. L3T2-6]MDV6217203.1 aminotransferase class IV [Mucilaginibacter sp. L3T2-6]